MTDADKLQRELDHANEIIASIDSGQWAVPPGLREHYVSLAAYLEKLLPSLRGQ